jgi:cell division protein FtsW (lipid II flippase)
MQAASPDSLSPDSGAAPAEYARRLAFEPEAHTDFIFVIIGADGRDITGGVLLALALLGASAAVGIWIWRRQHRHPGP